MREGDLDYRPDPLGRLDRGTWRRISPRDPFGRLSADEDEPLASWRQDWPRTEQNGNTDALFELGGSVGDGADNDWLDVAKVQMALHDEGRFDLDRSGGPTGYFSPPLAEAIRQRQADHGLAVDGLLFPGGETVESLKAAAAERERDSLGVAFPARPGERPAREPRTRAEGEQVAALPILFAPVAGAAVRWMMQEGVKRAAIRLGAELAKREAGAAAQAARGAVAAAAALPDSMTAPNAAAGASEPPKPELLSEDAVRAWLDAGRAAFGLPMAGSRGSDEPTQKALDIFAQECRSVLKESWPEFAEQVEHMYGSTKNGDGVTRQKEMVIKVKDRRSLLGANKADQSWLRKGEDPEKATSYFHINSGHTLADGVTPISSERRQIEGMIEKVGADLVYFIQKPEKDFDQDEYRAYVRQACIRIMGEQVDRLTKPKGAPYGGGK